ncbi:MAG TPA: DUF72 domain-containing protein [Bdellovibrionota bacterium]|nr:DUF72 domain-containing protein [Bdellovibrionota bacterium]
MEFGHLHDVSRIDFRLPADDPRSLRALGGARRLDAHARIGMPIWTQKAWIGHVYPKGTPAKEFLREYGLQFDTIELNSTHYGVPDSDGIHRWRDAVPPAFRFCPKVLQEISHGMDSPETPRKLEAFYAAMLEFGPKLGMGFMQLPPQFAPDRLPWLKRLFTLCPPPLKLALEFRHPDWFESGRLIEPAFDLMASLGLSSVITDVSGRRDVSHSTLTTPDLVVRFIGNAPHESDGPRLEDWAERLERWFGQGLRELHFFVHQRDNVLSPEAASEFVKKTRGTLPGLRDWTRRDVENQLALL